MDKSKYYIIKGIVFKYPNVIDCYDIMIHDYGLNNLFINLNILVRPYEDANNTISQQIQYDIYTILGYFCVIHEEKMSTDIVLSNSIYEMINKKIMNIHGGQLKIENFRMLDGNYTIFDFANDLSAQ